jgi:hypothetical protein
MYYYNVILKVIREKETVFLKYRNVNRLEKLFELVESQGQRIDYVNLYNARTKEKIRSYAYRPSK